MNGDKIDNCRILKSAEQWLVLNFSHSGFEIVSNFGFRASNFSILKDGILLYEKKLT
jgi:hypothetical protein